MEIHPVCSLGIVSQVVESTNDGDAAKVDWMQRFIPASLAAFECLLGDPASGRFCHGDHPGLADCCLIPQLYNARRWDVDLSNWPRITAIEVACGEIEAFDAAHPDRVRP